MLRYSQIKALQAERNKELSFVATGTLLATESIFPKEGTNCDKKEKYFGRLAAKY